MTIGILAVFLMQSSDDASADTSIAEAAIRCSGLFYVLTSIPDNAAAMNLAIVMANIYRTHEIEATGKSLTNGDLLDARDNAVKELEREYREAPDGVTNLYLRCNKWRVLAMTHFQEQGLSSPGQSMTGNLAEQAILSVPKAPATPDVPASNRQEIRQSIAKAFEFKGGVSRNSVKSALEMLIEEADRQEQDNEREAPSEVDQLLNEEEQ
jgi:hypothetical protein